MSNSRILISLCVLLVLSVAIIFVVDQRKKSQLKQQPIATTEERIA